MEVAKLDFHNNNKKASKLAGTFTISDRTIEKLEEDGVTPEQVGAGWSKLEQVGVNWSKLESLLSLLSLLIPLSSLLVILLPFLVTLFDRNF